jgi:FHS family L-fucose permease-like MFS transporter
MHSFLPFLLALTVIAFGLAFLETAANPYVTVMGPAESAGRRLNLAQSFNGLGWIFGPLTGGLIIFGLQSSGENSFSSIAWPYLGIGCVVLVVALFFQRTKFPVIREEQVPGEDSNNYRDLLKHRHFILSVAAQFFYVAAQTGINSFFINYTTETISGISNEQAAIILSFGGMGLFWAGRLSGSFLMRNFRPDKLLTVYAGMCIALMLLVIGGLGWFSVSALFLTYFFMSIMFPTIFSLGLEGLGPLTRKASSFLVMAIVGGALCPMLMGYIADRSAMQWGFTVPLVCFAVVLYYGISGHRQQKIRTTAS